MYFIIGIAAVILFLIGTNWIFMMAPGFALKSILTIGLGICWLLGFQWLDTDLDTLNLGASLGFSAVNLFGAFGAAPCSGSMVPMNSPTARTPPGLFPGGAKPSGGPPVSKP